MLYFALVNARLFNDQKAEKRLYKALVNFEKVLCGTK